MKTNISLTAYALAAGLVLLLFSAAPARAQTGGSIKGKIKEQGGKPLEGVLVGATSASNKDNKREIKSDGKGEFELTDLPAGEYSLAFEKQGYKNFVTRKLTVAAGETLKLSRIIELAREGEPYSLIRGAVLYGNGFSLPNAAVTIERIDGKKFKQEKISGEGGQFAFRLKAEKGKYRITASARGFEQASIEIEIESDEVRNVALTLQQAK